jgi:hypothetical protein
MMQSAAIRDCISEAIRRGQTSFNINIGPLCSEVIYEFEALGYSISNNNGDSDDRDIITVSFYGRDK